MWIVKRRQQQQQLNVDATKSELKGKQKLELEKKKPTKNVEIEKSATKKNQVIGIKAHNVEFKLRLETHSSSSNHIGSNEELVHAELCELLTQRKNDFWLRKSPLLYASCWRIEFMMGICQGFLSFFLIF